MIITTYHNTACKYYNPLITTVFFNKIILSKIQQITMSKFHLITTDIRALDHDIKTVNNTFLDFIWDI